MVVPGSHRRNREPLVHENVVAGKEAFPEVMGKNLSPKELEAIEWTAPSMH
jgi:hypothetical protein